MIALDAMGGDHAPGEIVAGAILAHHDRHGKIVLVGDRERLAPLVGDEPLEIVHAPDVVAMGAAPTQAIRSAATSSLGIAIELVREGRANAVVSAGSSGAFLAVALVRLRTIAGIARPAIATVLPTPKGPVVLIDAGANVDCKPEWLVQFGIMGSAYAKAALGIAAPRVGIVSIGEEKGKGNAQVVEAASLLEAAPLNFIGNAEGTDVFSGRADVLVTTSPSSAPPPSPSTTITATTPPPPPPDHRPPPPPRPPHLATTTTSTAARLSITTTGMVCRTAGTLCSSWPKPRVSPFRERSATRCWAAAST